MKKVLGILGFLLLLGAGFWGYQRYSAGSGILDNNKIVVGATIFPLADVVRNVGGDFVSVVTIIPPGVTEHASTLTPGQLQQLSKARAVFEIGHELESHLVERITAALPSLEVVPVDLGIALHEFNTQVVQTGEKDEEDHDTGIDPHYWLTVPNAIKITDTVARELAELDPEHAAGYRENATRYTQELAQLEQELQAQARKATQMKFLATHNAWSYFAQQYGFQLVATYEPVEGKQPSLADLQTLQAVVSQYHLTTFFAEPQKATSAVTEFMKREFGLKVATLDPIGGLLGRESYIELMRANMAALVE